MSEHPETDAAGEPEARPAADPQAESAADDLSGFEADLDTVAEALEALDGDDLDRAESLAASLEDPPPLDDAGSESEG